MPALTNERQAVTDSQVLAKLDQFVTSLEHVLRPCANEERTPDEETMGLLARIYKNEWRRTGNLDFARRSRDLYRFSYQLTAGYYTGINVASMSFLIGEKTVAQALANAVYDHCQSILASNRHDYWVVATMGEASLLLDDQEQATQRYREAAALSDRRYAWIVSSLQQVYLLKQHGVPVPDAIFEALKPPEIIVFVGHMIDSADRPTPRFPADLEGDVRAAIDRALDGLDARIGYCSAACGSDIIFIELMLARGAEVNIVLPFAEEDFLKMSVNFAGERWLVRYRNAIQQAHSVSLLTEESFLGDTVLFAYMARVFHGYAELRASTLLTEPRLLTVGTAIPTVR